MINATSEFREEEGTEQEQKMKQEKRQEIKDVLNNKKMISKDEWLSLSRDQRHQIAEVAELDHADVDDTEFQKIFDASGVNAIFESADKEQKVEVDTLIDSLLGKKREVSERSMRRLEKKIADLEILVSELQADYEITMDTVQTNPQMVKEIHRAKSDRKALVKIKSRTMSQILP